MAMADAAYTDAVPYVIPVLKSTTMSFVSTCGPLSSPSDRSALYKYGGGNFINKMFSVVPNWGVAAFGGQLQATFSICRKDIERIVTYYKNNGYNKPFVLVPTVEIWPSMDDPLVQFSERF